MLNYFKRIDLQIMITGLIGLFFILILHFKWSYSLIPALLSFYGMWLFFTEFRSKKLTIIKENKWIITAFLFYFLLFILSFFIHNGLLRELDLPSRALLFLPILVLFNKNIFNYNWVIYSIVLGAFLAGVIALAQVFLLDMGFPFPYHMHIQAGDIVASLSLFSLCCALYFLSNKQYRWVIISLFATLLGILASFLTTARGAWIGIPIILLLILIFNRKSISKWIYIGIIAIALTSALTVGDIIQKRWQAADNEIRQYIEHNNGSTSVGARFDMWKSALIGIQEEPVFGRGLEGVKEMRKQHFEQGKISQYASGFTHAHNQYLHDASVRGILGLIALLAIFVVPLILFWNNLKLTMAGTLSHLFGVIGIVHILSVMSYCLTQAFFAHNSGMMFYFFTTVILIGLQKITLNLPREKNAR